MIEKNQIAKAALRVTGWFIVSSFLLALIPIGIVQEEWIKYEERKKSKG